MRSFILSLFIGGTVEAQQSPNIIYIMSDDHDADAISAYNKKFISTPNIDRLAKEGMLFTRAFVGNSICSPARATLLTGQHSHKNGIKDNRTPFDPSKITMPKLLQQGGYQTAIVGKWHLHSYPVGFDYWKILPGQGSYFDPMFIDINGDTSAINGYVTDVITTEALNWLDTRDRSKPFVLLLHHKAPHRNFFPPLKYIEKYIQKKIPEPATLYHDTKDRGTAWKLQKMSILNDMRLCSDLKVDPHYLLNIPELKPNTEETTYYNQIMEGVPVGDRKRIKDLYSQRGRILEQQRPSGNALLKLKYQWYMQDYLACCASVDENIGRVLDYLDQYGLTKNTMVIYTSDQGFYLGENGWFDKRWMYDVSMNTPLIVRWPGHIIPNSVNQILVQNIDYAPTILDAANLNVPEWMQGISLLPLLTSKQVELSRKYLYYRYYEYPFDHNVLPHLGCRGERYKLVYFNTVNEWELYDLKNDPGEQKNLIHLKDFQGIFHQLKKKLLDLQNLYDDRFEQ